MGRGVSIRKPGDLLSEWERRRPDTRERKRNRIHAVPRPHAQAGRRGKWGTKDAHGPCSDLQLLQRRGI